ncbi:hypothetical protein [Patulibacter minatonensis]|uniref:hypothetical protein n=1 Tax=Patulibacter minatonensis TaxID=298163 RepID=UPI000479D7E3|nr:hypothetical protein [Patulibacter minatonensis]
MRRGVPSVLGVLLALVVLLAAAAGPAAAATPGVATTPQSTTSGPSATTGPLATGTGTTGLRTTVDREGPADDKTFQSPTTMDRPPRGWVMTGRQAERLALSDPKMQRVLKKYPKRYYRIYLKGKYLWQLSIYERPAAQKDLKEVGQLVIDDATQKIRESWDVPYVQWTMARGIDGAFGRSITNPWLWGGLLVLFLAPFVGFRPLRGPPVPLLLLAGFTAPLAFFNNARLDWAVPLSFGLLLSLFVWGLWRSLHRPRREPVPARILVPTGVLIVLGVGLLVFRIVLNVTDGNVIDVGYAGVVGADKIGNGLSAYGAFPSNVGTGNTYGPLTYLAYVPFEQVFPFRADTSFAEPSAHAASIAFDTLAAGVLFLVGRSQETDRRLGVRRGLLYSYLWLACPWTAYCLNSNSNDALPALMLGLVLLVGARPVLRGLGAAAAGATKIGPFGLFPVLMTGRRVAPTVRVAHAPPAFWPLQGEPRPATVLRGVLLGVVVLAGGAALVLVASVVALHGFDFKNLFDRTIAYQAGRPAPFMPWGFEDYDLEWLRDPVRYLAIGFALVIALVPRRHDVTGTAAIAVAVIVGLQMSTEYWFYMYLVWLVPLLVSAGLSDRPIAWPGGAPRDRPAVVPRMHGPVPEEDAPWAADVRRRDAV